MASFVWLDQRPSVRGKDGGNAKIGDQRTKVLRTLSAENQLSLTEVLCSQPSNDNIATQQISGSQKRSYMGLCLLEGRTLTSFYSFPIIKGREFHHGPRQVGGFFLVLFFVFVVGIVVYLITFFGYTLLEPTACSRD